MRNRKKKAHRRHAARPKADGKTRKSDGVRRKDDGKTRLARQLESLIEAGKSERDDPIFVWNFKLGVILLRFLLIILGCYLVNMKVDLARDEGPIKFMVAVSTPNAAGLLVLWFIVTVLVWILCIRMYVEAKRND